MQHSDCLKWAKLLYFFLREVWLLPQPLLLILLILHFLLFVGDAVPDCSVSLYVSVTGGVRPSLRNRRRHLGTFCIPLICFP